MNENDSLNIIDPEVEDRNEKFAAALMGMTSGQIFGLVALFMGVVGGIMSDLMTGLQYLGFGMGLFLTFSLLHLALLRRWTGTPPKDSLRTGLAFLVPAGLMGIFWGYATFSFTDWAILGYPAGILFVFFLYLGITALEVPPPPSRRTTYIHSPFDRQALVIVTLVGTILGVGIGMGSQGHRIIGRGPFARAFLADKITGARSQVDLVLFGLPKSYRLENALHLARKNGIHLRILVSRAAAARYAKDLAALQADHIPIRLLPEPIPSFLHPQALIDRRILLHGSGGWGSFTPSEGHQMRMVANILAIGEIRSWQKTFDALWGDASPLPAPTPGQSPP
ncbi:MAG: phospholipase D-like domain-containing protein [Leptospirillia bacterium]